MRNNLRLQNTTVSITEAALNREYGHIGHTFKSKTKAEKHLRENKEFNYITRCKVYQDGWYYLVN